MKPTCYLFRALHRWGVVVVMSLLLSGSTFAQTVLFRDDFNRAALGPDWGRQEAWSIDNGRALNSVDGTNFGYLITTQSYPAGEYVLESAASNLVRNYYRAYRLHFGQASLQDSVFSRYYLVEYDAYFGRLKLARSADNPYYPVVLDQKPLVLDPAVPHRFKIVRRAWGEIRVYLDRGQGYGTTPILTAVDQTYPALGHFGWQVTTDTSAEPFYVDYIQATTLPLLEEVRTANGKPYDVVTAQVGTQHYLDRPYTFTSLPAYLNGANLLRTANADKALTSPTDTLLQFRVEKAAVVYVAYDPRGTVLPTWLSGFAPVSDLVGTTDPGSSTLRLLARFCSAGTELRLGANLAPPATGSNMMYLVFAIPAPPDTSYQAEAAARSGPVLATTNPGYQGSGYLDYQAASQEFIEWTVNVPAAGPYYLGFRYALRGSSRSLGIQANGTTVFPALAFPATDSWSTWDYNAQRVVLQAGANTIRATSIGSSGPNVDLLSVSAFHPVYGSSRLAATAPVRPQSLHELTVQVRNPVAAAAAFQYQLPAAAHVRLRVFNWRGQPVGTLVDGVQQAGMQRMEWPTADLPQGVYFYRLETGAKAYSGRLVKN
ncbi:MAG: carbohydrate-binding protein [Hymenobacter sp.]|nr:carbohydrate-binding protein [Hymenobacter sp.]